MCCSCRSFDLIKSIVALMLLLSPSRWSGKTAMMHVAGLVPQSDMGCQSLQDVEEVAALPAARAPRRAAAAKKAVYVDLSDEEEPDADSDFQLSE